MKLKAKIIESEYTPFYATKGAAGFDIHAAEDTYVGPLSVEAVSTGLFVAVPEGYELQIRPRSGTVLKRMLTVANSPGTVDSDYRGEVKVLLYNLHSSFGEIIRKGERIAQGVICPVQQVEFEWVDELDETERGENGFGSTDN